MPVPERTPHQILEAYVDAMNGGDWAPAWRAQWVERLPDRER